MNRSLGNVLIGSFGGSKATGGGATKEQGHYKEISLSDAAVVMAYANKVMIVPGYGLAVAQAQHACHGNAGRRPIATGARPCRVDG